MLALHVRVPAIYAITRPSPSFPRRRGCWFIGVARLRDAYVYLYTCRDFHRALRALTAKQSSRPTLYTSPQHDHPTPQALPIWIKFTASMARAS